MARQGIGSFTPKRIALDNEGFARSFGPRDLAALRRFFEEFGFVVVRDVLSSAQVEATKRDIFGAAGLANVPVTVEQLDAVDWHRVYGSSYNRSKGFLGSEPPDTPTAWANRLSPSLVAVFAELFQRDELLVKIDRYGLMRPTLLRQEGAKEATVRRKEWQTTGSWIHWDQNPWEEPDFVRIQAVLAISEHTESSGGFHCVPGFCPHMQQWAAAHEEYRTGSDLISVPTGDPIRQHLQRVPMRAGSVVLWDARTPHGNYPNRSENWRMCQYLGFHPAPSAAAQPGIVATRQDYMRLQHQNERLPPCTTTTPLARKLVGLDPWPTSDEFEQHVLSTFTQRQLGLWDDTEAPLSSLGSWEGELDDFCDCDPWWRNNLRFLLPTIICLASYLVATIASAEV